MIRRGPGSRGCLCRSFALDLPAYQRKENWGAAETFYQLVRRFVAGQPLPSDGRVPCRAICSDRPHSGFATATT